MGFLAASFEAHAAKEAHVPLGECGGGVWVIRKKETIMTKTLHGVVRGKTIELDEDLGVVDGQEVQIQVTVLAPKKRLPGPPPGWQPGRASATAGALADSWTEEDDRVLEEICQDRKREGRREVME